MTENETLKDELNPFEYVCFMITIGVIFVILKIIKLFER